MLKIGEYFEGEEKPVVSYLKDAGMRVEQKAYLFAEMETKDYLEGRLSELRCEIKDIEKHEQYLAALKAALAKGATPDNLRDMLYSELDPVWAEKKREVEEIFKNPSVLSEEENETEKKRLSELMDEIKMDDILKMAKAYNFAVTTLQRNDIEFGQFVGDRLNDPILRIEVDPEDCKGHNQLRQTLFVDLWKNYELYIDEFSAPLYDELDEDFEDGYPEEYFKIRAMGILIKSLVEKPFPGKIDMESFADRCELELEKDGNILAIDGINVAEDIAKVLEKNGLVKIKGDMIKWKA